MKGITFKVLPISLVLGLLLLHSLTEQNAAGKNIVVVDADGNTNNYAALLTILNHPQIANDLGLVMVSGATFGHASTVVENICSFLSLAGRSSIPVALGQVSALVDAYNPKTRKGNCRRKEGFPPTPYDALLRGATYSKFDVSSAFGQTFRLPRASIAEDNCMLAIDSATDLFLNLLQKSNENNTISYLQLGSSTNLARILNAADNLNISNSLFQNVQIHAVETGYNGGADGEATIKVLDGKNMKLFLYLPSFHTPFIAFNNKTWNEFGLIAKNDTSLRPVTWLYEVLHAKYLLFELNGGGLENFYKECDPLSSLVTLCALDITFKNFCKFYYTTSSNVSFSYSLPERSNDYLVFPMSGNNVTRSFYYNVELTKQDSVGPKSNNDKVFYIYNLTASKNCDGSTTNLVDKFWEVWLDLLRR